MEATGSHPCLYRNKVCLLPRAIKKNGQLHSLCEFHRVKANLNQRRLEKKKKSTSRLPETNRSGCKELWVDPVASSEDDDYDDENADDTQNADHVIWAEPIKLPVP
ncbi:hypothetical protein SPRG_04862 [Saprolegnia parasitica CBS 223.65]|uniref:Uncharacterized protein n=1 Tax=Saprolegnia parasitica (strain CBS 223.65) TaxID=695850 RepID=A0A067CKN7_SAPPC|nr:hypothetical protein SPRG_04862 [Saprolegnia parasitica CBS 223.65]KDO29745.1 hypothetical protein SPRG_04862 [Saprolegnia parasitica CBS 223.65]|eukprot:XP_012199393.1 hypothetical protein SPRG_04862 [Saprolegnia parasitica CBS 223.65]